MKNVKQIQVKNMEEIGYLWSIFNQDSDSPKKSKENMWRENLGDMEVTNGWFKAIKIVASESVEN